MAKSTASTAPAATNDAFDEATGADFTRIEDVDGRALVLWAKEKGTDKGDRDDYEYVVADFIALDGEDTEKVTVGEVGEMRFTTPSIVGQLKKSLHTGRPRRGRIDSRPSKYRTRAYALNPFTEDELANAELMAACDRALATYRATQVDDEPFN